MTSRTQAIANLHNSLDRLMYTHHKNWAEHISALFILVDKLSRYDQELTYSNKVTKLARSIPSAFEPLTMASSLNTNTFDELVAVSANIERCKKTGTLPFTS